jgi:LacI family transcriptional regulator
VSPRKPGPPAPGTGGAIIEGDTHVYIQVANILRSQISYRQIAGKLPSIRELAKIYSVNFKTANRAVSMLVSEGLVFRTRGKGTFVANKAVRRKDYPSVGVIFSDIVNPNFYLLAEAIQKQAHQRNMAILINTNSGRYQTLCKILDIYRKNNVGAIIVQGGAIRSKECQNAVLKSNLLVVGDHTHLSGIDDVWLDVRAGAQMAVEHLVARFGPDVAFISGSSEHAVLTGRFQGFRDALSAHGSEPNMDLVRQSAPSYVGGYEATKELLRRKKRPRSIFYYNLIMANGGISALLQLGLKVPQDVAVGAIDDSLNRDEMLVPITTIGFSYAEEAKQIFSLIERRRNYPYVPPISIRLAPHLIVRDSSASR